MRIAVIITTYNRPDALAAVLQGYLAQTDGDFEVLVADDGSAPETAHTVREYEVLAPFPVRHIWHKDEGFRAAAIRNRALAVTEAEYVIFTDGDCVPFPDFVAQHRKLSEPGWFLSGNRILLTQAFTERVLKEKIPVHLWRTGQWRHARANGEVERLLPLLRLPDVKWLRKLAPQRWRGAKTCNLSAWRSDLLAVNGLDESYTGWGLEDSDLVVRLLRTGVRAKSARFAAPVLHLWHRENDRTSLDENARRLEQVLTATHTRAAQGVDQYR